VITWTDVVTAFATVGAALATVATLIFFGLQLRTQQRALQEQRDAFQKQIAAQRKQTAYMEQQTALQRESAYEARRQIRRTQASRIFIKMHRLDQTREGVWFEFVVDNRSGVPCYFVHFEVFDGTTDHYFRLGTLDTKYRRRLELGQKYRSADANRFARLRQAVRLRRQLRTEDKDADTRRNWPYFRLTFMDAAGVFWERNSLGNLRETSDSPTSASRRPDETFAERRAREMHGLGRFPAERASISGECQA
jgi:hypothetical protein